PTHAGRGRSRPDPASASIAKIIVTQSGDFRMPQEHTNLVLVIAGANLAAFAGYLLTGTEGGAMLFFAGFCLWLWWGYRSTKKDRAAGRPHRQLGADDGD